jgi:site-specific DNA-methyltransferase (adenine-specific)
MNKLFLGPCEKLMNNIEDKSIDLILCDLPYEISDCEWDVKIPFPVLWKHYNRIKKETTPIVLFANQPFTSGLINSNLNMYHYNWYWIKNYNTGFPFSKIQPMRCVEDICVFYEKAPVYNPIGIYSPDKKRFRKRAADNSVYKDRSLAKDYVQNLSGYPNNLLYFEIDNGGGVKRYHPTQKPVKLLEYLIRTYTNLGDTVLDNTMGSGSTGVAAINTGRHFIGIEKEQHYFDTAVKRTTEAEQLAASSLFDIKDMEEARQDPPLRETIQEDFLNDF